MIPGAGKSPSCLKRKSKVMRQHSESCTIDQQQEVHFVCSKKEKIHNKRVSRALLGDTLG